MTLTSFMMTCPSACGSFSMLAWYGRMKMVAAPHSWVWLQLYELILRGTELDSVDSTATQDRIDRKKRASKQAPVSLRRSRNPEYARPLLRVAKTRVTCTSSTCEQNRRNSTPKLLGSLKIRITSTAIDFFVSCLIYSFRCK